MPTAPKQFKPPGIPQRGWASRRAAHRGWYNLPLWRGANGLRLQQLRRQPLCEMCLSGGRAVPATNVDHRDAHRGDWQKFIDPANHRSLCAGCHSRKTRSEDMPASGTNAPAPAAAPAGPGGADKSSGP